MTTKTIIIIGYLVFLILLPIGWCGNLYQLFTHKVDVLIGILGVVIPPVGAIHFFFF